MQIPYIEAEHMREWRRILKERCKNDQNPAVLKIILVLAQPERLPNHKTSMQVQM